MSNIHGDIIGFLFGIPFGTIADFYGLDEDEMISMIYSHIETIEGFDWFIVGARCHEGLKEMNRMAEERRGGGII